MMMVICLHRARSTGTEHSIGIGLEISISARLIKAYGSAKSGVTCNHMCQNDALMVHRCLTSQQEEQATKGFLDTLIYDCSVDI